MMTPSPRNRKISNGGKGKNSVFQAKVPLEGTNKKRTPAPVSTILQKHKMKTTPASSGYGSSRSSSSSSNQEVQTKKNITGNEPKPVELDSGVDEAFPEHSDLGGRIAKTLYYANKLPSTPRPSFPLTVLAVNAFTSGTLGTQLDCLEFLDLEMASEIGRNACVTPTALIMALVYLDRLSQNNQTYLSTVNPSELFVVALLVASKFIQDDGEECGIYNDEWGSSANMDVKRVNKLELKFLDALDWRVNVKLEEYNKVLKAVEEKLAVQQGKSRGWFTYTELETLSTAFLAWNSISTLLYHYAIQVVIAATITYTAMVATLLTSSILMPQLITLSKGLMTSATTSLLNTNAGMNLLPTMDLGSTYHQPLLNFAMELEADTEEDGEGKCDLLDRNLSFWCRRGRDNETSQTRSSAHADFPNYLNLKENKQPGPLTSCYAKSNDELKLERWNDFLEEGMQQQIDHFTRPAMNKYRHTFGDKEMHFLYSLDSRKGIHY